MGEGVVEVREAKVNDLDIACLRDEDVLNLEVCFDALEATASQEATVSHSPRCTTLFL